MWVSVYVWSPWVLANFFSLFLPLLLEGARRAAEGICGAEAAADNGRAGGDGLCAPEGGATQENQARGYYNSTKRHVLPPLNLSLLQGGGVYRRHSEERQRQNSSKGFARPRPQQAAAEALIQAKAHPLLHWIHTRLIIISFWWSRAALLLQEMPHSLRVVKASV